MLFYRAALPLSSRTLTFVAGRYLWLLDGDRGRLDIRGWRLGPIPRYGSRT